MQKDISFNYIPWKRLCLWKWKENGTVFAALVDLRYLGSLLVTSICASLSKGKWICRGTQRNCKCIYTFWGSHCHLNKFQSIKVYFLQTFITISKMRKWGCFCDSPAIFQVSGKFTNKRLSSIMSQLMPWNYFKNEIAECSCSSCILPPTVHNQ